MSGDDVVAAMIDRLVHHAEVISLKRDSYRLKDRDLGRVPQPAQPENRRSTSRQGVKIQLPLTPWTGSPVTTTPGRSSPRSGTPQTNETGSVPPVDRFAGRHRGNQLVRYTVP